MKNELKAALALSLLSVVGIQSAYSLDAYTAITRYKVLTNEQVKVEVSDSQSAEYIEVDGSVANLVISSTNPQIKTLLIQGELVDVSNLGNQSLKKDVKIAAGLNRITVVGLAADGKTVLSEKGLNVLSSTSKYNVKSGAISGKAVWKKSEGPYLVNGDLVVNPGAELQIEAGTTVYFSGHARLTVNGKLKAEGTSTDWIYFTKLPEQGSELWDGIHFFKTRDENHISYAWITYGEIKDEGMVSNIDSRLVLENSVLGKTHQRKVVAMDASTVIRNNLFMSPFSKNEAPMVGFDSEHIKAKHVPLWGELNVENNIFEKLKGYNDAIDYSVEPYLFFTPKLKPTEVENNPVFHFNAFLGGGDDGIDLDSNALVDSNFFTGFNKDQWNVSAGESNAISTGKKHSIVVTNNVFYKMEHLATLKADGFMTFTNNTVVDVQVALALYNPEKGRQGYGKGLAVKNNLFFNTPEIIKYAKRGLDITASYNFGQLEQLSPYGKNNIDSANVDPSFVDYSNQNFTLKPTSSLLGKGDNGKKLGSN